MTLAYSQISDTLSENLLVCGCKYNAFFSILQLFEVIFHKKVFNLRNNYYLCIGLGEKS